MTARRLSRVDLADQDDEPEPCEGCGAPSVLYDVNLLPLCRSCADGCKYAPDDGEMVH